MYARNALVGVTSWGVAGVLVFGVKCVGGVAFVDCGAIGRVWCNANNSDSGNRGGFVGWPPLATMPGLAVVRVRPSVDCGATGSVGSSPWNTVKHFAES